LSLRSALDPEKIVLANNPAEVDRDPSTFHPFAMCAVLDDMDGMLLTCTAMKTGAPLKTAAPLSSTVPPRPITEYALYSTVLTDGTVAIALSAIASHSISDAAGSLVELSE
jgi:hypothetical protein